MERNLDNDLITGVAMVLIFLTASFIIGWAVGDNVRKEKFQTYCMETELVDHPYVSIDRKCLKAMDVK